MPISLHIKYDRVTNSLLDVLHLMEKIQSLMVRGVGFSLLTVTWTRNVQKRRQPGETIIQD